MARRILIADDEPNIVSSLEFLMESSGYETLIARNGEEVLTQVIAGNPDLILLNITLPLKDGFEACREIRANPSWRDIRIIMVSARSCDSEMQKCLSIGADAYITKPFSPKELLALVRLILKDIESPHNSDISD
ncbi:MAG: response regulator [Blastocatellia bacterium]|nr:response regulator [Blastocatellia bacterium]